MAATTSLMRQLSQSQVLCPLESVPLFSCVGLNYKQHAEESGSKIASYPVVFMKPPDALAGK